MDQNKKNTELETELTVEREEFQKFQDKSIEYQRQREDKIKELEAKVVELTKKIEKETGQTFIPLEDIDIIVHQEILTENIGVGTSRSPC